MEYPENLPMWHEAQQVLHEPYAEPHEAYELATIDFRNVQPTPYENLAESVKIALEFLMHYACNGELFIGGGPAGAVISDEVAQQYWDFVAEHLGLPTGPEALRKAEWQLRGN